MRRILLKTAFLTAVMVLTVVLLAPTMLLLEAMYPRGLGSGALGQGDRLPLGVLIIGLTLALADRAVSFLFRVGHLSEGRWSVFDHGPRRRSR